MFVYSTRTCCSHLQNHQTSLHMAVQGGSTDVVQTLLDHCVRHSTHRFGETLYITDDDGCTALFIAAQRDTVVSTSNIDMMRLHVHVLVHVDVYIDAFYMFYS